MKYALYQFDSHTMKNDLNVRKQKIEDIFRKSLESSISRDRRSSSRLLKGICNHKTQVDAKLLVASSSSAVMLKQNGSGTFSGSEVEVDGCWTGVRLSPPPPETALS